MTAPVVPTSSGLQHPPFAPGGDPRRKLFFLHVQKCAGTSVRTYLESLVHPDEVLPAYLAIEVPDPSVLCSPSVRLVRGHMPTSFIEAFEERPAVVTTLRDPVTRLLSHFEFEKKWRHTYSQRSLAPIGDLTLDRALDIPEVRRLLDNRQARTLMRRRAEDDSITSDSSVASTGVEAAHSVPLDEVVAGAIATLDDMDWIGITEFIDECMPLLASHVGASPTVSLPVTNVLDVPKSVDFPSWVADLVSELTAADEIVYRHGVESARRAIAGYRREEHVRRWSDMLTERAVDLDGPIDVRADELFGGTSWWPAEMTGGGNALRWSGPGERATIDLPVRLRPGDTVEMVIAATIRPEFLADLALEVNGLPVRTDLDLVGEIRLRGTMPTGVEGPWTSVTVHCPTLPWREVHPDSTDSGRRGVAFRALRLLPVGA